MTIGNLVGLIFAICIIVFLCSVKPAKAFEQSFCTWNGTTQSCTNYRSDENTGNTETNQSIQYNASNPNQDGKTTTLYGVEVDDNLGSF